MGPVSAYASLSLRNGAHLVHFSVLKPKVWALGRSGAFRLIHLFSKYLPSSHFVEKIMFDTGNNTKIRIPSPPLTFPALRALEFDEETLKPLRYNPR